MGVADWGWGGVGVGLGWGLGWGWDGVRWRIGSVWGWGGGLGSARMGEMQGATQVPTTLYTSTFPRPPLLDDVVASSQSATHLNGMHTHHTPETTHTTHATHAPPSPRCYVV